MSGMRRPHFRFRIASILTGLVVLTGIACAGTTDTADTAGMADAVGDEPAVMTFARTFGFDDLDIATVQLGAVEVLAVVADTPAARERGLQGVDEVPAGVGMLFVFPDPPGSQPGAGGRPGFWMLDTIVPLDIAFAAGGTVVGVATMQPCAARPCPITHPGVEYDVALELAAGELARAGVGPGDRLEWEPVRP